MEHDRDGVLADPPDQLRAFIRDGRTSFTHIGIAVYRDSSGTVWLTQDFSS